MIFFVAAVHPSLFRILGHHGSLSIRVDLVEVRTADSRKAIRPLKSLLKLAHHRDVGHVATDAVDILVRARMALHVSLHRMAVLAGFLHGRIGDLGHPIGAALTLLIVAGHAGQALFEMLAHGMLLELVVVDLSDQSLGLLRTAFDLGIGGVTERLHEIGLALNVEFRRWRRGCNGKTQCRTQSQHAQGADRAKQFFERCHSCFLSIAVFTTGLFA